MADSFEWWQNALNGNRGPIHDGEPQSGFYRQRRKDKIYEPVAYWKDASGQRCHVNGRETDQRRALEMWPYVSKNPITAEAYWHRMDTGTWADNDAAAGAAPEIDPEQDPVGSLKAEIAAAKAGIDAYKQIESDEASARAQTLRSTLTRLAGKATKAYEALNRPLLDEQQRIRKVWFPLRDEAAAGADALRKALGLWEDQKREAAKKAQTETDRIARDHADAVRKAEEANQPPPPEPPKPVATNTPPPSTKIKGATGRTASVSVKPFVVSIDIDKAFQHYRLNPELLIFLIKLCQASLDAGITVDGIVTEDRSIIR